MTCFAFLTDSLHNFDNWLALMPDVAAYLLANLFIKINKLIFENKESNHIYIV